MEAETPPSTGRLTPVMKAASALARKGIAAAMSAGTAGRPRGTRSHNLAIIFLPLSKPVLIGVSVTVGHTELTRTPCRPKSKCPREQCGRGRDRRADKGAFGRLGKVDGGQCRRRLLWLPGGDAALDSRQRLHRQYRIAVWAWRRLGMCIHDTSKGAVVNLTRALAS